MIISLNYHSHTICVGFFQFIVRDKLFTKIMLTMFKAGHKLWLSCIISKLNYEFFLELSQPCNWCECSFYFIPFHMFIGISYLLL